ncbi:MAG: hypothetical protein V3T84_13105 [Phycisphaerales bacterium]
MTNRVFILGAGFSKPADFPLAAELTDELVAKATLDGQVVDFASWLQDLCDDIRDPVLQDSQPINVEDLIESALALACLWRSQQYPPHEMNAREHATTCEAYISYLQHAVADVIWSKHRTLPTVPDYVRTFAKALGQRDCVISFNYDIMVERALNQFGVGYHHGLDDEHGDSKVPVLKMHGSIDWTLLRQEEELDPSRVGPTTRLFGEVLSTSQTSNGSMVLWRIEEDAGLGFVIKNRRPNNRIMGLAGLGGRKAIDEIPGLGRVWSRAHQMIHLADEIHVVGFSLSPNDLMARLMISNAMRQRAVGDEPTVHVIDPSVEELMPRYAQVFRVPVDAHRESAESVAWDDLAY